MSRKKTSLSAGGFDGPSGASPEGGMLPCLLIGAGVAAIHIFGFGGQLPSMPWDSRVRLPGVRGALVSLSGDEVRVASGHENPQIAARLKEFQGYAQGIASEAESRRSRGWTSADCAWLADQNASLAARAEQLNRWGAK